MQGSFSRDSLRTYSNLISETHALSYGESESSSYDFTRCVRPNGTAYGTEGACRSGVESPLADILKRGIKGRVPRNDPKEPLASGNTPLEKAEAKLSMFESLISDPDRTVSEKELEQYGKLKNAVDQFRNVRDGRKVGLFQREDRSDLDESKSRRKGEKERELWPTPTIRREVKRAQSLIKYHRTKGYDWYVPAVSPEGLGMTVSAEKINYIKNKLNAALESQKQLESLLKNYEDKKVKWEKFEPLRRLARHISGVVEDFQKSLDRAQKQKLIESSSKPKPPKPSKKLLETWRKHGPTEYEVEVYNLSNKVKYQADGTISYHP